MSREAPFVFEIMLNERQKAFVENYLETFNAKQAAVAAGYSGNRGSAMLQNPKIRDEIDRRRFKTAEDCEVTKEKVLAEYAKVAFATDVEIKGSEKMKALDFWAKWLKMFDCPQTIAATLADLIQKAYDE